MAGHDPPSWHCELHKRDEGAFSLAALSPCRLLGQQAAGLASNHITRRCRLCQRFPRNVALYLSPKINDLGSIFADSGIDAFSANMSTSPTAPSLLSNESTPTFLGLPLEIRNEVYNLCFTDAKISVSAQVPHRCSQPERSLTRQLTLGANLNTRDDQYPLLEGHYHDTKVPSDKQACESAGCYGGLHT